MSFEFKNPFAKKEKEVPVVPENAPAQDLSGLEGIRPKNIVLRTESEVVDHEVEEAQRSIIEEPAGPAPILPSKTMEQKTPVRGGAQEAPHVTAYEPVAKSTESLVDQANGGTPTMPTLGEHQEKNGTVPVEESATENTLNGHTPSWAKPSTEPSSEIISVSKEPVTPLERPRSASEKSAEADMESLKDIREKIAPTTPTNSTPEIHPPAPPEVATIQSNETANEIIVDVVSGMGEKSEHPAKVKQEQVAQKVSTTEVGAVSDTVAGEGVSTQEKAVLSTEVAEKAKSIEPPTAANDNFRTSVDERPSEEDPSSPERDALREAVEEALEPKIKKAA